MSATSQESIGKSPVEHTQQDRLSSNFKIETRKIVWSEIGNVGPIACIL
jgi:hypothetical protein